MEINLDLITEKLEQLARDLGTEEPLKTTPMTVEVPDALVEIYAHIGETLGQSSAVMIQKVVTDLLRQTAQQYLKPAAAEEMANVLEKISQMQNLMGQLEGLKGMINGISGLK